MGSAGTFRLRPVTHPYTVLRSDESVVEGDVLHPARTAMPPTPLRALGRRAVHGSLSRNFRLNGR